MQIHALNLYPIKALGGLSLQRAQLTTQGLAIPLGEDYLFDRQWMLINPEGKMVTQRQVPGLACLQPQILDQNLYLSAPGLEPILVQKAAASAAKITSQVWKTPVEVQECSPLITQWLERALPGLGLRLVSLAAKRPVQLERFGPHSSTQVADAAPYLVANTASLTALNQALTLEGQSCVDARRFRANIWLEGLAPFAEHQLSQLEGTGWAVRLVDHCQRCSVITVHPDQGTFCPNALPFKTLTRLNPMPNQLNAPAFGVNAVFERDTTAWIALGDGCYSNV